MEEKAAIHRNQKKHHSATGSTVDSVADFAVDTAAGTTVGKECSTRGQLSFKVGEGVQSTAVKDFYLSVSSQRKKSICV